MAWPKGKKRARTEHIDVLAEVVLYGRNTLKMTDAEMAAELGYSRERIRQARERKMGKAFRCKAGHLLPPGRFVYCEKCDPPPRIGKRILCLQPGCKRMSHGGECSQCRARRRWVSDPAFREKHTARVRSWAERNPERAREINQVAQRRYGARKRAGWEIIDPLRDK